MRPNLISAVFNGKRFGTVAVLTVIFSAVLSVNSLIQAIKWIDKPFPGFLLFNNLVVSQVSLPHWAQQQPYGLQPYDKVLEVDEKKVQNSKEVYDIIGTKPLRTPITYLILRGNNHIELTIPTMKFTLSDLLTVFGIEFVIGLAFLISGALVFFLKPDLLSSKVFLMFCSSIGIWFIEDFDYQTTYSLVYSLNISYLAQVFSPSLLIFLTLIFPNKKAFFAKYPKVVLFPLFLSSALFIMQLTFLKKPFVWEKIDLVIWFYLIFAALTMLASVTVNYLRPHSKLDKQRAQVVLIGALLGFFLPALGASIFISFGISNINYLAIPVLFFPLSIAYAIVKHKLFDIDVIIQKALVYGTVSGAVAGFFVLMVLTFNVLFANYGGWRNPAFFIVLSLFVVVALNPLKNHIQKLIDLTFYRTEYDYRRTIEDISSAMTSLLNIDEIADKLINTIRWTMFSSPVYIFLFDHNSGGYRVHAKSMETDHLSMPTINGGSELIWLLNKHKQEIFKEDLTSDEKYMMHGKEVVRIFEDLTAALFIPMFFKDELIGVLSLGDKKSGLSYNSQDIKLLRILANQSAIAIENAFAFKLVEDYAKKLEDANKEIRDTQAQLIQAEKMSAIGHLAAGIAHEIRNPLNIIEGARYYLAQIVSGDNSDQVAEYLDYIKHEIDRTNRLIDNLLKFSRSEPARFEPVNVNSIIENALILIRKQLYDNNIRLNTNLDPQIPAIMGDPNQLWQVFINILMNAIQAMPDGGELTIRTVHEYGRYDRVLVTFADTGLGIDEEDLSKIFDPFFTKKDTGTGLGLSISYNIIEEHEGRIIVTSKRGRGTTFVVELLTSDAIKGMENVREKKSISS